MNDALLPSVLLLLVLSAQTLVVVQSASLFIKNANNLPIPMTDILYLFASVGFFGLMLVFIWACEKV